MNLDAKQCDGPTLKAPKREVGEMTQYVDNLPIICDRLNDVICQLDDLCNCVGVQVVDGPMSGDHDIRPGLIGKLEEHMNRTETLINMINSRIDSLIEGI